MCFNKMQSSNFWSWGTQCKTCYQGVQNILAPLARNDHSQQVGKWMSEGRSWGTWHKTSTEHQQASRLGIKARIADEYNNSTCSTSLPTILAQPPSGCSNFVTALCLASSPMPGWSRRYLERITGHFSQSLKNAREALIWYC